MFFQRRGNYIKSHLIDIEFRALQFRKAGKFKEAAELFAAIVKEQPDWEHGTGFYNLALCYEDMGELALAEQCFGAALRYEPKNQYFLGGFASFLYLHGDPDKAFNSYLELLEIESANKDQKGVESVTTALRTLGKKMGMPEEAVTEKIGAAQR